MGVADGSATTEIARWVDVKRAYLCFPGVRESKQGWKESDTLVAASWWLWNIASVALWSEIEIPKLQHHSFLWAAICGLLSWCGAESLRISKRRFRNILICGDDVSSSKMGLTSNPPVPVSASKRQHMHPFPLSMSFQFQLRITRMSQTPPCNGQITRNQHDDLS